MRYELTQIVFKVLTKNGRTWNNPYYLKGKALEVIWKKDYTEKEKGRKEERDN